MKCFILLLKQKLSRGLLILSLNKKYYRNENILKQKFQLFKLPFDTISLDVGSGPTPKNPFLATMVYGADLRENQEKNVVFSELAAGKLPFEDSYFDYVTCFDVLEHIQRVSFLGDKTRFPFIQLINEIFRVLKPGGIFFNMQPSFPFKEAFQDPTHVNIMTEDTIYLYFCEPAWARIYGYEGSFVMVDDGWLGGEYFSFIKKSHNKPISNLNFVQK